MRKGIAPSSRQILEKKRSITQVGETIVESRLPPPLTLGDRKWLKSWRYRWGVAIGSLGHRKEVAKEVMRDKACDVVYANVFLYLPT